MDHVTYILIMFRCVTLHPLPNIDLFSQSIAFALYTFIVFLIHLYSTTGRNAATKPANDNVEMSSSRIRPKWYARVPNAEANHGGANYIVGDDEEDELDPR